MESNNGTRYSIEFFRDKNHYNESEIGELWLRVHSNLHFLNKLICILFFKFDCERETGNLSPIQEFKEEPEK